MLESPATFRRRLSWTVGRPPLVFLLSLVLSLPLFLSPFLLDSISVSPRARAHTHTPTCAQTRVADAAGTLSYTFLCLYVLWGGLCSDRSTLDARRSTRGYYIVKPFNYLGKLLPGIFALRPALTSVHGYSRVWGALVHSPFPPAVWRAASPLSLSLSFSSRCNPLSTLFPSLVSRLFLSRFSRNSVIREPLKRL